MGHSPRRRAKPRTDGVANHSAADAIAHKTRTARPGGCSPLVAMLLLWLLIPPVWGQDLGELGGVVIAQVPPAVTNHRYIGSPSITILEDGTYLASHDIRVEGELHETRVFRSTDQGQSWTGVSTIHNLRFAILFTHGGFAYILGLSLEGDNVVRESLDQGSSWSAGQVIPASPNTTPSAPVIYHDRIWFAAANGNGAASAPLTANPMDPGTQWKFTNWVDLYGSEHWLDGGVSGFHEGQIVASPHTGVVVLPIITDRHAPPITVLDTTALIHVSGLFGEPLEQAAFNPDAGFVELPGAEKKFGCVYDAVSQKFYALTNPVLAAHEHDPDPVLIRNTGAVLSSTDLRAWQLEKIFLYSPHVGREAFQYFQFAIDGDDLAVVSRTGFAGWI